MPTPNTTPQPPRSQVLSLTSKGGRPFQLSLHVDLREPTAPTCQYRIDPGEWPVRPEDDPTGAPALVLLNPYLITADLRTKLRSGLELHGTHVPISRETAARVSTATDLLLAPWRPLRERLRRSRATIVALVAGFVGLLILGTQQQRLLDAHQLSPSALHWGQSLYLMGAAGLMLAVRSIYTRRHHIIEAPAAALLRAMLLGLGVVAGAASLLCSALAIVPGLQIPHILVTPLPLIGLLAIITVAMQRDMHLAK